MKVRLNFQITEELDADLTAIASAAGCSRSDVIRHALALLKVAHQAHREGKHFGMCADAARLDTQIVGLL